MKREIRVIDGKVISGHVSREGKFVDVRELTFNFPRRVFDKDIQNIEIFALLPYYGSEYKKEGIKFGYKSVYLYSRVKYICNLSKRITKLSVEIDGIEAVIDCSIPVFEYTDKMRENDRIIQEKIQRRMEIIKFEKSLFKLANEYADKIYAETPKNARRYSSGVDVIDPFEDCSDLNEMRVFIKHRKEYFNNAVKCRIREILKGRKK